MNFAQRVKARRASSRKYYWKNKDRLLREVGRKALAEMRAVRYKLWREKNPEDQFIKQIKQNAQRRSVEFTLSRDHVLELLAPMTCSVTGIKLEWMGVSRAPSLDRIDCSRGYVLGNVRVVSWIYNRAKGRCTDEEVFEHLIKPLMDKAHGATSY